MQAAIKNMLKDGLQNIADETVKAYIQHLVGLGPIEINGQLMTESALVRDYTDFAKPEFKDAGKALAKEDKKHKKKSGEQTKQKRTKNAYVLFCEDTRPSLTQDGLSFTEASKRLGELWANQETKAKYQALAQKLKEESLAQEGEPAMQEKIVAVKTAVEKAAPAKAAPAKAAPAKAAKAAPVGSVGDVKYATAAARKFAFDNNIDGGLEKYGGKATGKDGAFKLADLKAIVKEMKSRAEESHHTEPDNVDDEDQLEEEGDGEDGYEDEEFEEGDEEVDEEVEEEVEEDSDPAEWIGWSCRVWSEDADDWEYGEITKYNAKKSLHTVKFNDSDKTRQINIKKLEEEEHFEWDE